MNIKQQFFDELSEVLEKEFPKGERCSCGKRLPCRSKALVLNAYANIIFKDCIKEFLLEMLDECDRTENEQGQLLVNQFIKNYEQN